jgi:hypothetical protein
MSDGQLLKLDDGKPSPREERILKFLKSRIKGQDRALQYFAKAYARAFSPLRDPKKPLFVGLLLGPSGVGKTLLAETLSELLFGDADGFTKIACAEFSERHEVSKVIGAPPGYVGYVYPGDDPAGSQYVLGQKSIDKHCHEYLKKRHQKELEELNKREKELVEKGQELKKLQEGIKELLKNIGVLKIAMSYLKDKISELEQSENQNEETATEIKKMREELEKIGIESEENGNKLKELNKDYLHKRLSFNQESEKFDKDIKEAAKRGWIYDEHRQEIPKNLISVVLFDEIEKASEALFNAMLEIMDKGRLQLGNGLITSFKNSFILMTGNVGSKEIAELLNDVSGRVEGFGKKRGVGRIVADPDEAIYQIVMERAREVFRPEFLGRIDKKIVFRPLPKETMKEILESLFESLVKELAVAKYSLKIKVGERVKEHILDRALKYPEEGARLLKSRVNDYIKDPLIALIDTGQLAPNDTVVVKLEKEDGKEKIVFYKELSS